MICCVALATVCAAARAAEKPPPGPVAIDEVARMLRRKIAPAKIVEVIRERGMSFEVPPERAAKLKKAGFTGKQIAELQRMAGAVPALVIDPDAAAAAAAAAASATCGPRKPDAFHETAKSRLDRIIKTSGLGVERHPATNVTLVASPKTAKTLFPFVKSVEKKMRRTFPGALREGCDPRSAHIAVLDSQSAYEKWITAMIEVTKQDGITWQGGADPKQMALGTASLITPFIDSNDLSRQPGEQIRRAVAYQIGHKTMYQVAEARAPDALVTGFGDAVETLAMGSPSVMVYSYAPPNWKNNANMWAETVRGLARANKLPGPALLLTYSDRTMQPQNYAEAWSFVNLLARKPKQLDAIVRDIRDKRSGALDAIRKHTGLEQEQIELAWRKFVLKRR